MLQVRGLVELAGKALCWMYARRIPAAGAVPAAADFNAIATPSKWSVGLMVIEVSVPAARASILVAGLARANPHGPLKTRPPAGFRPTTDFDVPDRRGDRLDPRAIMT